LCGFQLGKDSAACRFAENCLIYNSQLFSIVGSGRYL
jgi:hypothetical protein